MFYLALGKKTLFSDFIRGHHCVLQIGLLRSHRRELRSRSTIWPTWTRSRLTRRASPTTDRARPLELAPCLWARIPASFWNRILRFPNRTFFLQKGFQSEIHFSIFRVAFCCYESVLKNLNILIVWKQKATSQCFKIFLSLPQAAYLFI